MLWTIFRCSGNLVASRSTLHVGGSLIHLLLVVAAVVLINQLA